MAKKAFLMVFALSILALNIVLIPREPGETTQQDAVTQPATRLDYIADQSPSIVTFDPLGRM